MSDAKNDPLRSALEQVKIVCEDNEACDRLGSSLALKFVLGIAERALRQPADEIERLREENRKLSADRDDWQELAEEWRMLMSDELNIVINGQTLTAEQAMAVQVAITSFHAGVAEAEALGGDELGRRMTAAYRGRLSEVLGLMP